MRTVNLHRFRRLLACRQFREEDTRPSSVKVGRNGDLELQVCNFNPSH
jgi:hypothetical protein